VRDANDRLVGGAGRLGGIGGIVPTAAGRDGECENGE
jgi:hypothetical protein